MTRSPFLSFLRPSLSLQLECHKALPPELWREVLSFGGQQESADLVRASLSCQHPHRLSLHGRAAQRYLTQEPHDAHRATVTHHLHLFRLPGDPMPLLFLPPNLRSLSLAYARCPLQALPPLPSDIHGHPPGRPPLGMVPRPGPR